jgi:hypothetical protein
VTKSELNKFRNVLEAKQAELVQLVRNRDGIAIEKSADAFDEVRNRARAGDPQSGWRFQSVTERSGSAPALRTGHQRQMAGGGALATHHPD